MEMQREHANHLTRQIPTTPVKTLQGNSHRAEAILDMVLLRQPYVRRTENFTGYPE
jgi:hypothetical protein